jgi:uncharacterized protein (DUF885 family)
MLEKLAAKYWEGRLESAPVMATALGVRDHDARMGSNTPASREAERARLRAERAEVEAVDASTLEGSDVVTRGELLGSIDRDLDHLDSGTEEWLVSHMMGPGNYLMAVPDMQVLRNTEEAEAYVARIEDMGRWVDEHAEDLRRGLAAGKASTRKPVEHVIRQLNHLLDGDIGEWPLAKHLATVPEGTADVITERGRAALEDTVAPALARYRDLLEDQVLPVARPEEQPGMCHLPGGAEAYARLAHAHTSLTLTPEEIHQVGVEEVERILEEFQRLGEELMGTHDLPALQQHLREDEQYRYESEEQIERIAREAVDRAEAALDGVFGLKPEAHCEVKPIPPHEAPNATLAYYRQPSPDGSRPGAYYINTYDPTSRPMYEAEVLAFHEAVPGHHLQIDIAQRLHDLPEFRRHGGVTAYVEGWALYTEKLSEEMGLYTGLLDRLGARSFDAWRACRLVVDTGLNALGWSRQKAIDYMVGHTLLTPENVANEVDRYVVMPGQALSYKLGELEIYRLRRHCEETMGERFELPGFHDRVLEAGAVSLGVLGERLKAWARAAS